MSTVKKSSRLSIVLLGPANSIHIRRWALALADRGHKVVVVSWIKAMPIDSVEVRAPDSASLRRKGPVGTVLRLASTVKWLRKQLAEVRPDVVHVHSVGMAALLSIFAQRSITQVVTPWGSDLRYASKSLARRLIVWLSLRKSALVLTTSTEVRTEVQDRYRIPASRTAAVSWGVEDRLVHARRRVQSFDVRQRYGIPVGQTILLSFRSIGHVYRTDEIIQAFEATAPKRPDLHLVIVVGHNPAETRASLAQAECTARVRAAAERIPGRITLVEDRLDTEELFELMRVSAVAISVPHWDQRSTSVLEAALAGCRLILSHLAAYREMAAEGLAVDLVPEPIGTNLVLSLRNASSLDHGSQSKNRTFIETKEVWSRQVDDVVDRYRTHLK